MNAISAAELAQIQADMVAAVCDKTCIIQRSTTTKDTAGSQAENYAPIATTVAGISQPTAGQLTNYAYIIGSLAAWQVRLPIATDVRERDYLIINGQTMEVQVLLDPHSYPGILPVLASEIR
jgi:hypothetical protein